MAGSTVGASERSTIVGLIVGLQLKKKKASFAPKGETGL